MAGAQLINSAADPLPIRPSLQQQVDQEVSGGVVAVKERLVDTGASLNSLSSSSEIGDY